MPDPVLPRALLMFDIVSSVSETADLVDPALADHHLRVAWASAAIARELGWNEADVACVVVAAMLHDIGALDDRERIRLQRADAEDRESRNLSGHAEVGWRLLSGFPPLRRPARSVRHHHLRWDRRHMVVGEPAPPHAHVLHLADRVVVLLRPDVYAPWQARHVLGRIRPLAGAVFAPDAVEALESAASRTAFWLDLTSRHLPELLRETIRHRSLPLAADDLLALTDIFARAIDFRSPFTATHSAGVAAAASHLAGLAGFDEEARVAMRVAGHLHDLGKLAIPNAILCKPGRLTSAEMDVMRQHTWHTWRILHRLPGMDTIARWAAFHHERPSGGGYPFGVAGGELDTGCRIMAVADVFTAITEDRPYRAGMTPERATAVLADLARNGALDGDLVDLLLQEWDALRHATRAAQDEAVRRYEALRGPLPRLAA